MNGTLELNASEIESLESQLEENGRVISSYEDSIEEKHSLSEQVSFTQSFCCEQICNNIICNGVALAFVAVRFMKGIWNSSFVIIYLIMINYNPCIV